MSATLHSLHFTEPSRGGSADSRRGRPAGTLPRLSQRLGESGRLFLQLKRFTATSVARVIAVRGTLPPRQLEEALQALCARRPLLRAALDVASSRLLHDAVPALRLRVVARRGERHWRQLLEEILNRRLDPAPGPLFTVYYLYGSRSARSEILVVGEHCACDGVSINRLCAELLDLCAGAAPGPSRPVLPLLEGLLPAASRWCTARSVAASFARLARISAQRALLESRPLATNTAHTFRELTRLETERLVRRAREERTTITGALMAATLSSVAELVRRPRRLAMSVPIDLRPRIAGYALGPEDLGHYTSVAYLDAQVGQDFWALARAMKGRLQRAAQPDRLLPAVKLTYRAGRLLLRGATAPLAHLMVSSSGVVPMPREHRAFRAVGFYSATSCQMLSADVSFFCNTFDGRLCLNLVFSESILSRREAERLARRVRQLLASA